MSSELAQSNLFKPIKVGTVLLKNRLVYAPTTRFRNTEDFVATDSMLKYYTDRATDNGGLLTIEATFPSYEFGLYERGPMIKTEQQVAAFKKIVQAVHKKGSFIGMQLWNLGRIADPKLLKKYDLPYVAPSPIYVNEESEKAAKECGNELRELSVGEIQAMVKEYAAAARRAVYEAGFDLIEIHAAHMYLLDQFLQESSNQRKDEYGGSIENRARFMLEVVDACIDAVGAEHVAIRLSPYAKFEGGLGIDSRINPMVTWGYVLSELERRGQAGNRLAYISIVEPVYPYEQVIAEEDKIDYSWPDMIWKGVVIRAGGFLDKSNISNLPAVVNSNDRTLIAVGRYYTSNPDLAARLKNSLELTHYDRPHFYTGSNIGYLDFQKSGEPIDHSMDTIAPKALA